MQHMPTTQVRELEVDELVLRLIYAEVPVRVEYELAALALSLNPVGTMPIQAAAV
jgi:DNA-binding HxlR family transcriptional regulator